MRLSFKIRWCCYFIKPDICSVMFMCNEVWFIILKAWVLPLFYIILLQTYLNFSLDTTGTVPNFTVLVKMAVKIFWFWVNSDFSECFNSPFTGYEHCCDVCVLQKQWQRSSVISSIILRRRRHWTLFFWSLFWYHGQKWQSSPVSWICASQMESKWWSVHL